VLRHALQSPRAALLSKALLDSLGFFCKRGSLTVCTSVQPRRQHACSAVLRLSGIFSRLRSTPACLLALHFAPCPGASHAAAAKGAGVCLRLSGLGAYHTTLLVTKLVQALQRAAGGAWLRGVPQRRASQGGTGVRYPWQRPR